MAGYASGCAAAAAGGSDDRQYAGAHLLLRRGHRGSGLKRHVCRAVPAGTRWRHGERGQNLLPCLPEEFLAGNAAGGHCGVCRRSGCGGFPVCPGDGGRPAECLPAGGHRHHGDCADRVHFLLRAAVHLPEQHPHLPEKQLPSGSLRPRPAAFGSGCLDRALVFVLCL